MKFLLSWLKEYIDVQESPAELAKILTSLGLEVDSISALGKGFDGVVVGRVVSVEKHPNADKLCIATVSDGFEDFQVVCGAKNCRAGILTAFAKLGATLTDQDGNILEIKKTKIRDVESFGMLCAEDELLLSKESDGIMEFSSQVKEGTDVAKLYEDTFFEVSLTPNLGHCMSILGIASELSAAISKDICIPEAFVSEGSEEISSKIKVSVEDPNKAPRYCCRVIEGVSMVSSPEWMQRRLIASGVRPINAVVDITNYVFLETGQPLHAFDLAKIPSRHIIVRSAKDNESFVTLDGQERILKAQDLLICQGNDVQNSSPIAIGGVMGGLNSEVDETTKDILIESAYFDPPSIRQTSKRLGLQTDASRRFERNADPNISTYALDRAAMLINALAGGNTCQGVIDVASQIFPEKRIACRLSRVNDLLGTHLGSGEVENIFNRLKFGCRWDGKDLFSVQVPTSRADINEEIDLVEEVARIYGYDNIPKVKPKFNSSLLPHAPMYTFENKVRSRALAEGLQEVVTCDLIGPSILNIVGHQLMPQEAVVKVLNPTSIEQSILRTSLLPGLLQAIKYNYDHHNHDFSAFEIGRIHFKDQNQYKEQSVVGIVMTGKGSPHHWDEKPKDCDFYDLKGIVVNVLETLGCKEPKFAPNSLASFHSGRQASFSIDDLEIGSMGEVHPSIVCRLDIPQRIYFAEINLYDLYQFRKGETLVKELATFPASTRDWTVTISKNQSVVEIIDEIQRVSSPLLEKIYLQDLYESDKLGQDKRNATFHFVYRDNDKTVSQVEVDNEHLRIIEETHKCIRK